MQAKKLMKLEVPIQLKFKSTNLAILILITVIKKY